ncbi:MAG: LPS-assembly protein LptD [Kiritimatiellae bacterium]|nr:LPS-assembly protein LptD [Kiritimatiellia bacterium]
MKTITAVSACALCAFSCLSAAAALDVKKTGAAPYMKKIGGSPLEVKADVVSFSRETGNMVATGNVRAVSHPLSLYSGRVVKDGSVYRFDPGTVITTCTNDCGHLHWSARGSFEYRDGEEVSARNVTLSMYGAPVMWFPYWFYPLNTDYGWRVTPGYTSRWGAYLLTKYVYGIAGSFKPGAYGLGGSSRFDLRAKNGVALGQGFGWQLGDTARGRFKAYWASDNDADRYERHWTSNSRYNYENWGSEVKKNRYSLMLEHSWEPTERDIVRLKGAYMSDSHFQADFLRDSLFGSRNRFAGVSENEIAWEHAENSYAFGVSASGMLNDFYTGVSRLPEVYLDVMPQSVFTLPAVYESATKAGWYNRDYAKYGNGSTKLPFRYSPGMWADYQAFRLDSYHRVTAPFKVADVVSVVPRFGFRGTYWSDSGVSSLDGRSRTHSTEKDVFRSIVEGGVTFSSRATGWIGEEVKHVFEPYADFLAQEASYSGLGGGRRPYLFDSADRSREYLDQLAGRSRSLPYSWYGVTPGLRNAFVKYGDGGAKEWSADIDVYAAVQFNETSWTAGNKYHRLPRSPKDPVSGSHAGRIQPGGRVSLDLPSLNAEFFSRLEFDCDDRSLAYADVTWRQTLCPAFNYSVSYLARDHRIWDFSSSPYEPARQRNEDFNWADFGYLEIECEHELCDAVAWGPFIRWDVKEDELDEIGSWIDYRTDCLGFRFMVAYENECRRIDRSVSEHDWRFGFFIYLRAIGPSSGAAF